MVRRRYLGGKDLLSSSDVGKYLVFDGESYRLGDRAHCAVCVGLGIEDKLFVYRLFSPVPFLAAYLDDDDDERMMGVVFVGNDVKDMFAPCESLVGAVVLGSFDEGSGALGHERLDIDEIGDLEHHAKRPEPVVPEKCSGEDFKVSGAHGVFRLRVGAERYDFCELFGVDVGVNLLGVFKGNGFESFASPDPKEGAHEGANGVPRRILADTAFGGECLVRGECDEGFYKGVSICVYACVEDVPRGGSFVSMSISG